MRCFHFNDKSDSSAFDLDSCLCFDDFSCRLIHLWVQLKYHDNPGFVKAFKWIQFVQLLALYAWYIGFRLPLANSLPLYHCRLAMFAMIFLPDKWKIKAVFCFTWS